MDVIIGSSKKQAQKENVMIHIVLKLEADKTG
jgi:hypothetical protein